MYPTSAAWLLFRQPKTCTGVEVVPAFGRVRAYSRIRRPGQSVGKEGEWQQWITLPSMVNVYGTNKWDQDFLKTDLGS